MIIHSKQFFTTSLDEKQIQPNAVDICIAQLYKLDNSTFSLTDDSTRHRTSTRINIGNNGTWHLEEGSYRFETDHMVDIPKDICGWVITRSSLVRNGIFLISGLYDSGYKGNVGGFMHITCGSMVLARNMRIGQFITIKAETNHLYDGQWNGAVLGKKPKKDTKKKASELPQESIWGGGGGGNVAKQEFIT